MSDSCARNSRFVNSTSTMPVQLTKLVMSASVTVRPIVLNCRPTGKSSKQKPSPTVSIPFSATASRVPLLSSVGDGREARFAAGVVDDLQDALAVRKILQPELLDKAGIVDQVIAGGSLAAGLVIEGDLRIGQEFAHQVGELAETDRRSTRIVNCMARLVGQQNPGKHLGDVVDMDRGAHRVLVRE